MGLSMIMIPFSASRPRTASASSKSLSCGKERHPGAELRQNSHSKAACLQGWVSRHWTAPQHPLQAPTLALKP